MSTKPGTMTALIDRNVVVFWTPWGPGLWDVASQHFAGIRKSWSGTGYEKLVCYLVRAPAVPPVHTPATRPRSWFARYKLRVSLSRLSTDCQELGLSRPSSGLLSDDSHSCSEVCHSGPLELVPAVRCRSGTLSSMTWKFLKPFRRVQNGVNEVFCGH